VTSGVKSDPVGEAEAVTLIVHHIRKKLAKFIERGPNFFRCGLVRVVGYVILYVQYTTAGRRHNEIVPVKVLCEKAKCIAAIRRKPRIGDGLPAARLLGWVVYLKSQPSKDLICGDTRLGVELIDVAGDEQSNVHGVSGMRPVLWPPKEILVLNIQRISVWL
jgi:hypothetical protein